MHSQISLINKLKMKILFGNIIRKYIIIVPLCTLGSIWELIVRIPSNLLQYFLNTKYCILLHTSLISMYSNLSWHIIGVSLGCASKCILVYFCPSLALVWPLLYQCIISPTRPVWIAWMHFNRLKSSILCWAFFVIKSIQQQWLSSPVYAFFQPNLERQCLNAKTSLVVKIHTNEKHISIQDSL